MPVRTMTDDVHRIMFGTLAGVLAIAEWCS